MYILVLKCTHVVLYMVQTFIWMQILNLLKISNFTMVLLKVHRNYDYVKSRFCFNEDFKASVYVLLYFFPFKFRIKQVKLSPYLHIGIVCEQAHKCINFSLSENKHVLILTSLCLCAHVNWKTVVEQIWPLF